LFSLSSCSYLQWLSLRSKCGLSVNFSLFLSLFLVKCIFCYQSKVKPSLAEFTKCLNYVCLNTLNKLKSRSRNIIYKWVKRIILIFQWLRKKVKSEIDIIIKKILINSYSIFCHPLPCNTGTCIICLKNNDNNQNKVIHVEIAFLVVFFFTEAYYFIYIYIYLSCGGQVQLLPCSRNMFPHSFWPHLRSSLSVVFMQACTSMLHVYMANNISLQTLFHIWRSLCWLYNLTLSSQLKVHNFHLQDVILQ